MGRCNVLSHQIIILYAEQINYAWEGPKCNRETRIIGRYFDAQDLIGILLKRDLIFLSVIDIKKKLFIAPI